MSLDRFILVGDNPFHRVSHLSQERARTRGQDVARPEYAAQLVATCIDNGADGFMFTRSETTLSILRTLSRSRVTRSFRLYAIVPYAFELVRIAVVSGGIIGLAQNMMKHVASARIWQATAYGLKGAVINDPRSLLKSYLSYEVSEIRSAASDCAVLSSVLLHEIVTDMALALNMDWLFKTHIDFLQKKGLKPGFETRNFAYLVKKFDEWGVDFRGVVIAAPFNSIGFQMCPSREECEKALAKIPEAEVIAFSILAAGYLKLPQAVQYVTSLPHLKGVCVGVSNWHHACETIRSLRLVWQADETK